MTRPKGFIATHARSAQPPPDQPPLPRAARRQRRVVRDQHEGRAAFAGEFEHQVNYFYAGSAEDLKQVYQGLSSRLVVETRETEISALFAAAGALLAVLAGGLSVWWFGRVM